MEGFVVSARGSASYAPRPKAAPTSDAPLQYASHKPHKKLAPKQHFDLAALQAKIAEETAFEVPHFDVPKYTPPERPTVLVSGKKRWVRVLANAGAIMGLFLVITGSYVLWRGYVNMHKVFNGTGGTVAALTSQKVAPELLDGEGDGRVNILLLGVGGPSHPGGDLTDTIVVFSVDPVNGTASMLSLPRDLWVKMPVNYFGAYQKINAAYSSGKYSYLGKTDLASTDPQAIQAGMNSIDEAVSSVLGVTINYHVLVNFEAFREAIDTVDGVTVDVKTQVYDPTIAWENNNNPIIAGVGLQTMDGAQALNYARSRKTSSDFARNERQRELLVALKDRVMTLGTLSDPTKIASLMDTLGNNVYTDLSAQAATRLFGIMSTIEDDAIASLSLTEPTQYVTTDRVGNISVVRPIAGFDTYSDIQDYVRSQLRDGYLIQEDAAVYVVAPTQGIAEDVTGTLEVVGYKVIGGAAAALSMSGTNLVDLSGASLPYTRHYLESRYETTAASALPPGIEVPSEAQFVILIGT